MLIFDIIFITISLLIGFNFKNRFKIFSSYDKSILNKLFVYHILFAIIFFLFISSDGGDAITYWFKSYAYRYLNFNDVWQMASRGSPTGNILLFNYIPAKILQLSFLTGNILYGVLGYFGFVFFYAIIKENVPQIHELKKSKLFGLSIFPLILFLPNIHFWSAGIGKDTLLFFCIALFIYSLSNLKKRFLGIMISVLFSMLVRPHITLFLIVAFGIAYTMDGKLKGYQKVFILIIFIVGFFSIFQYVLQFLKLENIETETISNFATRHSTNLGSRAGSAVDISGYPYPFKVFTFLYRPLFFDAPGVLGILSSLENLILLILSIKILMNRPFKAFKQANYILKGLLLFFIMGAASFSLVLGNLGIMIREKTPFVIVLIIFGFWVLLLNKKYNFPR